MNTSKSIVKHPRNRQPNSVSLFDHNGLAWRIHPLLAGLALVFGFLTTASAQLAAPSISPALVAESKSETAFDLIARVNPNGSDTNVTFEYSTNSGFTEGVQSVGPYNIGSGTIEVEITAPASGLGATSTWFWRVVAVNSVNTATSAARQIFKVAVMPSHSQGVKYGKVLVGTSRNVWGRVWGGTAPYTYQINFGDGSAPASGAVSDTSYIQADKTYATSGIKRFTLTVTDASGNISARRGTIRVLPDQTTADRVDMAIEKGLVYLYRNKTDSTEDAANRIYWRWGNLGENHSRNIGSTGAALLAFAENEHLPSEDAVEEIYAPLATKARNYLLAYAVEHSITNHSDGVSVRNSDTNGNGKGVYFLGQGGYECYSSCHASLAMIMSLRDSAEAQSTQVAHGPLAGTRTFHVLIQDIVDQLLWAQGDGAYRGNFEYPLNVASRTRWDASAIQWPSLVMGAATDRLELAVPQWFHDNAAFALDVLTFPSTGGVGYSSNTNWRNLAKTGGALAALAFGERFAGDNAQANLNRTYISNYWFAPMSWNGDNGGWTGQWYAMYGLKKGLKLQNIINVSPPEGERNWQLDFNAWLLGDAGLLDGQGGQIGLNFRNTNNMFGQQADGKWRSTTTPSTVDSDSMTTANAILIMSEAVTRAVPVAIIEPIPQQTNKPLGRAFEVDGSKSYHLDDSKAIVEYLWDFDSSDGLDWDAPDATGAVINHPGYATVGTYTITLLVRDNSNPVATSITQTTVSVTDQDVPPIAIAKPRSQFGPYAGRIGQPITLDGSESYDPDGDIITLYEWDLNGNGQYDDATGMTTTVTFDSSYEGSIGLRVTANGKVSTNRTSIDIVASDADLDLVSAVFTNVVPNVSADVALVMRNDPDSGRSFNGIKLRFYNGNPFRGGGPIGSTQTVNFISGQTVNLNLTGLNLNGASTVWVYLDSDNDVSEFDESNNVKGPFFVGSNPNYIIRWGAIGADPADGLMDATLIPNDTNPSVIYSGMDQGQFDLHASVAGLGGNGPFVLGGEIGWYMNPRGSVATTSFRFYSPGSTTPHPIRNIHFSIEDAEPGEELSDFSYWDENGIKTPVLWSDSIFTYSHTPAFRDDDTVVENGSLFEGKTQAGKHIRVDLRGIPVTGIEFGFRKSTASAGSIVITHLTGHPGKLEFEGNFSPLVVKANPGGQGQMPDYRAQASWQTGITGTVSQVPAPGTLLAAGDHTVNLTLTTSDDTAQIGFDMSVIERRRPVVTVTHPRTDNTTLNGAATLELAGVVRDFEGDGITAIEITYGGQTQNATLAPPDNRGISDWRHVITPVNDSNTFSVSALDVNGIRSLTVTRTFNYTRRHSIAVTASPSAGTVSLKSTPARSMSLLSSAGATKTYNVEPNANLSLTARGKPGYVFSHWTGIPSGATVVHSDMALVMPTADITGLVAHFVTSPFHAPAGAANTFLGLVRPAGDIGTSNDSVAMITGSLVPATGAFSGKVLLNGLSHSFRSAFTGNGTCWFTINPATRATTLTLPGGHVLGLSFDTENGTIIASLSKGGVTSQGVIQRGIYTTANKVPQNLLNQRIPASLAQKNQGFYTAAIPSKAQTPARTLSTYPQGDGLTTITLRDNGTLILSGVLADGSSITASSALITGDASPLFAQINTPGATTKGGSFSGSLFFAPGADNDVTGTDLLWIRPAVTQRAGTTAASRATQLYTAGWPSGIQVDVVGAFYDTAVNVKTGLALPSPDNALGNAELNFNLGKLISNVSITTFNINDNTVVKIPAKNRTFTLVVNGPRATFNGTFTPNWTPRLSALPAFRGILLQKGTDGPAGCGFFISNRVSDLDPESGRATLAAPNSD